MTVVAGVPPANLLAAADTHSTPLRARSCLYDRHALGRRQLSHRITAENATPENADPHPAVGRDVVVEYQHLDLSKL